MRAFICGTVAALVLSVMYASVGNADASDPPQAEPVTIDKTTVPAPGAAKTQQAERVDPGAADLVAQLPARRTDDFGLVGVTWSEGYDTTGMAVEVRLRTSDSWSTWEELHLEVEPSEGGREGTEPLWVGAADGVAVRVTSPTGQRPSGLSVATIDPGVLAPESPSAATPAFYTFDGSADSLAVADRSPRYTARPSIISRSSWGARRNTTCDSPRVGNESRGVVVHHTAGTNSYSRSQSRSIVRAVQSYHMKARGWCDIGYNFLVDKYGQIFEGRNGGMDRAVRGAHAGTKSVNTYTMGVSMMGTFTSREPYDAQKTAMVKLIGWRVGTTFHPAKGSYRIGSRTFQRIAGHRNVVKTQCPGTKGYAWLGRRGGLRDRVAGYVANYSSPVRTMVKSLGSSVTGPVYVGEYATGSVRKARLLKVDVYDSSSGTHAVAGEFRSTYNSFRAQSGPLGAPSSGEGGTARWDVRVQRFAGGSIYRVKRGTHTYPYAIWGAIDVRYHELGEADGELGAPTTSEISYSDGSHRARFDDGEIVLWPDGSLSVSQR